MNTNFPPSSGSVSLDRSIPAAASQRIAERMLSSIQTLKQLKAAELKGEKIPVGDEHLVMAIERAAKSLQGKPTYLEVSVHEKTNQIMVKVLDYETGDTLREIPPEKTLDFIAKIWEMAGLIVDERK
ncbi:flagellar protein FlaG [Paenibacillus senegalensis]|uniref:flagellar protein FlaG n=1 Tax=Paenibacillus senegalensis TaxID=1465766 RepID=UPI00028944CB|nr:flagellar protein FlaG [Paenibacillus senegalensis]